MQLMWLASCVTDLIQLQWHWIYQRFWVSKLRTSVVVHSLKLQHQVCVHLLWWL